MNEHIQKIRLGIVGQALKVVQMELKTAIRTAIMLDPTDHTCRIIGRLSVALAKTQKAIAGLDLEKKEQGDRSHA